MDWYSHVALRWKSFCSRCGQWVSSKLWSPECRRFASLQGGQKLLLFDHQAMLRCLSPQHFVGVRSINTEATTRVEMWKMNKVVASKFGLINFSPPSMSFGKLIPAAHKQRHSNEAEHQTSSMLFNGLLKGCRVKRLWPHTPARAAVVS